MKIRAQMRYVAAVTATAITLSLALAACGGDEEAPSAAPPTATATKTAAAAGAPDPALVAQIPRLPAGGPEAATPDQLAQPQPKGTFVGRAGGKDAPLIGFLIQDERVVVYLCDGKRVSDWFGADVVDGEIEFRSAEGTAVSALASAEGVDGTLRYAGETSTFTAVPVKSIQGGPAGLFVNTDSASERPRWIVLPGGFRGASEDGDGNVKRAFSTGAASTLDTSDPDEGIASGGQQSTGGSGAAAPVAQCINFYVQPGTGTVGCNLGCTQLKSDRALYFDKATKATKGTKESDLNLNRVLDIDQQLIQNGC